MIVAVSVLYVFVAMTVFDSIEIPGIYFSIACIIAYSLDSFIQGMNKAKREKEIQELKNRVSELEKEVKE